MRPAIPSERSWPFEDALETDQEWAKYNRHYWKRDYIGFLQFFFAKCFNEPHSSKQIEDLPQTIPQTLVDITRGIDIPRQESFRETCARVRCPTLVIQGDRDLIGPHAQGAALARATPGELVTLRGCGHIPTTRDPVRVNLAAARLRRRAFAAESRA